MIKRALLIAAAAGAAVAAGGTFIVALAYALFALVRPALGPAGAAAVVAGAAALLMVIALLALALKAGTKRRREPSMGEKAVQFAREKPLVAAAAALGASIIAVRNPGALLSIGLAFLEGRSEKKR